MRTNVLAAGLRDCLGYCVFFMIGPQPHNFREGMIPTSAVLFSLACSLTVVFAWTAVNLAIELNGTPQVFDWWLGKMQAPLDFFEDIHLCGKQIAAIFYDTRP
jgi:hypothetical protein